MPHNTVAVVGAAETTKLGVIPDMSQIQLHADAALNAMADCGLKPKDIDGVATAGETPVQIAHYLGITPTWVDGTSVGGCSFMIHVRHAAAAIEAGLAKTILVTHGESGRSGIGRGPRPVPASSLNGQFEQPFGPMGPPSLFPIPVLRYMKTYGVTHEQIAMVSVVQREWAGEESTRDVPRSDHRRGRAELADDRLPVPAAAMLPGHRWRRCLDPDLRRPRQGFSHQARLYPRHRGKRRDADGKPDGKLHQLARVQRRGTDGVPRGRHHPQGCRSPDDLRRVRAPAVVRAGGSGLRATRRSGTLYSRTQHRAGGKLPLNTNGGGLSYMHSGMYGMYALQESVRQMRGTAPAQVPGAKISVCHGVGGMFAASGTIIFSNQKP